MNPRIRTIVPLLALAAALVAPAGASASGWASLFSTPTTCVPDPGPFTSSATDNITVPVGFQNANVNVALAGTNVDQYQWMVDCGSVQSAASGTAPVIGDGSHRFSHRVRESGTSNWTPWVDDTVYIDTSTPVNSTTTSTAWRTGPVTVPLTVSDNVSIAHGEWKVDTAPSWTVGNTATVTGTGTHTLYTSAVDQAGNRDDRSQLVRVDDTVPVDNTTAPAGWQQDFADITLAGADAGDQSGVATVVWQLDSGTPTPGNNGDVLHVTANGTHTLKTYVVDNAGNQSVAKTQTFQVDSAGPADTTTVPSGWVTTATQNVTISGTDTNGGGLSRIEWQIPEDARSGDVASGAPIPLTISGEGVHTLKVRLTDGYGHVTGWTDHVVRIDSTLPVDRTSISSAWQAATSVNVTVYGTDVAPGSGVDHVDWKVDGVPGTALGDTGTAVVSGQGEHLVETKLTDVAGNSTGWTPHTVRLDSTAPTNLTQLADTGWRNAPWSAIVNGSDSDSGVAAVQWRIDSGVVNEGTNGIETARVTADGTQHLFTRIKDNAGNYSVWRDETIKIDTVKPTDTTAAPGSAVGNGHKIPVTATDALSGPSGNVRWQLDSGPVQTSSQATIVGAGAHTLKTQVEDNAHNWSDWKSTSVTVNMALPSEDVDPPVDNTVVPAEWQTGPTTVTVTADDGGNSGVAKVQWRVDGQPIQTATGASGTFTVSDDGAHDVFTRATDNAGNTSVWKPATLKIDATLPVDTTALPSAWANTRTFTLTATDATSGVDKIEYTVNGVVQPTIANGATITLPSDGTFTVGHRVYDNAGQMTSYKFDTFKVDTVVPTLTSAAAPTAWQTSPLSVDITGTDAASGFDHAEWKLGATGTVHTTTPAVLTDDGTPTLYTRVVDKAGNPSAWRQENVKIDTTKPANTTPAITGGWRRTTLTTSVTGTDATSGVARVEWKLDNPSATPTTTPAVSVTAEGAHTLWSRVVDVAGNASDWRQDDFGIDKTAPALSVDCGPVTWRNTAPACSVVASGGPSGLPTLTASRGGVVSDVSGGQFVIDADGPSTVNFHAVDGAGNEAAASASVKVDRVAPTAGVSCAPGAGVTWVCTATGGDALSGLSALSYSVDGSAGTPIAPGATFAVTKGKVVVTASDAAGNVAASAPAVLADRTPGKTPDSGSSTVTPRSDSEAVLLKRGGSANSRLVGQLALSSTPTATTVDLRPLALGSGRFQFVFKLTTGKKTKTITKTQTTKKGYSKRISVKVAAAASAKVALTVKKRSGRKWVTHASASANLG